MRCAFTQRLSSVSSEAIIAPMSSGKPGRPNVVASETILFTAGLSRTAPPLKSVCMAPGAIAFTVIRRGPSSLPGISLGPQSNP